MSTTIKHCFDDCNTVSQFLFSLQNRGCCVHFLFSNQKHKQHVSDFFRVRVRLQLIYSQFTVNTKLYTQNTVTIADFVM